MTHCQLMIHSFCQQVLQTDLPIHQCCSTNFDQIFLIENFLCFWSISHIFVLTMTLVHHLIFSLTDATTNHCDALKSGQQSFLLHTSIVRKCCLLFSRHCHLNYFTICHIIIHPKPARTPLTNHPISIATKQNVYWSPES